MMNQVSGFWKFLDNLQQSSPEEYKKFIDEQMTEMKTEISKEKDEEVKKQTITSNPGFCMKALVAKRVDQTQQKDQKKDQGIKLFDNYDDNQIKESFLDNDEKGDPLEEPKLFLNIVYSDQVLPPLNKQSDLADQDNDRDWQIIPIAFNGPFTRQSLDGLECIHYDAHMNTCVVGKMKQGDRPFRALMNYVIAKFQQLLKDQFIIHKKSVKFLKKKKYKDYKGTESQKVYPFLLPKEADLKQFQDVKKKLKKEQDLQKMQQEAQKVQMPTVAQTLTSQEDISSSIKIPGAPSQSVIEQGKKKPMIIEVIGKTIPNSTWEETESQVTIIFNVEEEISARDIDVDVSENEITLNSKNYEYKSQFKGYSVDPASVKAKFNKSKKTLKFLEAIDDPLVGLEQKRKQAINQEEKKKEQKSQTFRNSSIDTKQIKPSANQSLVSICCFLNTKYDEYQMNPFLISEDRQHQLESKIAQRPVKHEKKSKNTQKPLKLGKSQKVPLPYTGIDQLFMIHKTKFLRSHKHYEPQNEEFYNFKALAEEYRVKELNRIYSQQRIVYDCFMKQSPYYQDGNYQDNGFPLKLQKSEQQEQDLETGIKQNQYLRLNLQDDCKTNFHEKLNSFYKPVSSTDETLIFESRFESGNLHRAIQIDTYEYDLYLKADHKTNGSTQWFYFKINNAKRHRTYQFHIVNFVKPESSFNDGMKPIMYSKKYSDQQQIGWFRVGEDISYYQSSGTRQRYFQQLLGIESYQETSQIFTLSFKIQFKYDNDEVYMAYCFPYTYTDCQKLLSKLCQPKTKDRVKRTLLSERQSIVLTGRVHPGESNASFIMEGILKYLILSNESEAQSLRNRFVFKIVPMLNPDGVIVGNYRCSTQSGGDLNRQWVYPDQSMFPEINATKLMIQKTLESRNIFLFCDFHGHSRSRNSFIYGQCSFFGPNKGAYKDCHFNISNLLDIGISFCKTLCDMSEKDQVKVTQAVKELKKLHKKQTIVSQLAAHQTLTPDEKLKFQKQPKNEVNDNKPSKVIYDHLTKKDIYFSTSSGNQPTASQINSFNQQTQQFVKVKYQSILNPLMLQQDLQKQGRKSQMKNIMTSKAQSQNHGKYKSNSESKTQHMSLVGSQSGIETQLNGFIKSKKQSLAKSQAENTIQNMNTSRPKFMTAQSPAPNLMQALSMMQLNRNIESETADKFMSKRAKSTANRKLKRRESDANSLPLYSNKLKGKQELHVISKEIDISNPVYLKYLTQI
eukprot:403341278